MINVTGGKNAAGIGTGVFVADNEGTITINGGTVTATGGQTGAGIGSGHGSNNYAGKVVINGGTDNENLINVVKALYRYAQTANAYFVN